MTNYNMIEFQCSCGKKFVAKSGAAGKTFSCPSCAKSLIVPNNVTSVAPEKDDPDRRALKKCPYCAEMILEEATQCKYCGSSLFIGSLDSMNQDLMIACWTKRIGLFLGVNFLVVMTVSFLLNGLGVRNFLYRGGINLNSLLTLCFIWGMTGAFISLLLSKYIARLMMGVKIIDPATADPQMQFLVETVHTLARNASLPAMPEVGIFDSPEVNAFATGPTRGDSLVAVSTGLLKTMETDEIAAVIGHEIAHIANGDMVTMTLIQGIVNAFVMFLSRAVAFAISASYRGNSDEENGFSNLSFFITQICSLASI